MAAAIAAVDDLDPASAQLPLTMAAMLPAAPPPKLSEAMSESTRLSDPAVMAIVPPAPEPKLSLRICPPPERASVPESMAMLPPAPTSKALELIVPPVTSSAPASILMVPAAPDPLLSALTSPSTRVAPEVEIKMFPPCPLPEDSDVMRAPAASSSDFTLSIVTIATSVSPPVRDVIAHALAADLKLDVAETKRRHHATHLARGAAHEGFELVVCLGGDGTLLSVARRLRGRLRRARRCRC